MAALGRRKASFTLVPKKPTIGTIIKSELSFNPKRIMQIEAIKERQREMQEHQNALREARTRQARQQMENYAVEERISRAEFLKQDRKNLEQLRRMLKSEMNILRIPKELRTNPTFMRNYSRELLNVLTQFGQHEAVLKNPKLLQAINTRVIESINQMSPLERRAYLGRKNNFVSFLAQTTELAIEQMQQQN